MKINLFSYDKEKKEKKSLSKNGRIFYWKKILSTYNPIQIINSFLINKFYFFQSDIEIIPETNDLGSPTLDTLLSWLHNTPPLSPAQLKNLCITQEDFNNALRSVQPSAKREGFATVPDVTWDDVGSLADIREELKMSILVINIFYAKVKVK